MGEPLNDLLQIIADFERRDTVKFKGKQIRLSRIRILLPCNDRDELIGIDAEVVNFHAKRTETPVWKSRWVPVGEIYMMQEPDSHTWGRSYEPSYGHIA